MFGRRPKIIPWIVLDLLLNESQSLIGPRKRLFYHQNLKPPKYKGRKFFLMKKSKSWDQKFLLIVNLYYLRIFFLES